MGHMQLFMCRKLLFHNGVKELSLSQDYIRKLYYSYKIFLNNFNNHIAECADVFKRDSLEHLLYIYTHIFNKVCCSWVTFRLQVQS